MPLPPGSTGLPLIGETLSFIDNTFGFISTRVREHGPVFRSSILGHPTAFLTGPDACEVWLDEDVIQRQGSFPSNVEALFAGTSLPLLDGAAHRIRKELVLSAFSRKALATYVPTLERLCEAALREFVESAGSVETIPRLKRLALEGIARTVLGVDDDNLVEELLQSYASIASGFTALPIKLPGTAYSKALAARDRVVGKLKSLVEKRMATPGKDGISRMIAARAKNGEALDVDELKLELHHVLLAGLIVYAEFAATLCALTDHPGVRSKLAAEVRSAKPESGWTVEALFDADYLGRVVMEVKRTTPNVPVSFGRAKREFSFGGCTVPEGWFVFMATFENNLSKQAFTEPEKFDPERYAPPRSEHEKHAHAFVPQGAGTMMNHKCAGYDLSTVFMQLFAAALVDSFEWELPEQDRSLRFDKLPPEPKSGLVVSMRRKRET